MAAVKHEHDDSPSLVAQTSSIAPLVLPILTPRRSTGMRRKRALSSDEGMANDSKDDMKLLVSDSPSPTKRKRGYATPETYAHLDDLPDILANDLDVLFCGINPGQRSAEIGHHFGHPTNHFWSCLYESGFTTERLPPTEDHTLPERFSLGLTNLVDRPTAEQNELSANEQVAGVPALLAKVARYRPRVLCFVGLDIARTFQKKITFAFNPEGKKPAKLELGLQSYKLVHANSGTNTVHETLFYAMPSTSGRVTQFQQPDKVKIFMRLRQLVGQLKCSQLDTENMHVIAPPAI